MTGLAHRRHALEDSAFVASLAADRLMSAFQRKIRAAVIEVAIDFDDAVHLLG